MKFSDLMIAVDEATDIKEIHTICDYITANKKNYSLAELHFAKEHIAEKTKSIAGK